MVAGSGAAIVIAYVVRFLTIATGSAQAGLSRVSTRVDDAARTLGQRPGGIMRLIHIPLSRPALGGAALLVFVDCLKELPATLLLRPLNVETLSTYIYQFATRGNFEEGALAALLIVAAGIVPVIRMARYSDMALMPEATPQDLMLYRRDASRCLALLLALLVLPASAQDYPARPVEIVVPFAAGGGTDLIARVLAERLSESLKQRFVVINRPGASTNIGTAAVANAPADGYTLLLTSISLAANPSLYRKLSFDPQRDLAPIVLIANSPSILVVNPSLPVNSAASSIAHLKARPGALNYASYGAGSGPHLAAGLFQDITGTRMQHVPYGGGSPATIAVLRGEVQLLLAGSLAVRPMIQSGGLKPLGIAAEQRAPALPDIPTFREQGIDYLTGTWFGLLAPAKTPPAIIALLNREVLAALRSDAVRARIAEQGADVVGGTPDDFAQFLKEETERLAAVIRRANIQLD